MAVRLEDGRVAFGHGGSVAGYTAGMLYDRKAGVGVIVLRSAGGGKGSATGLAMRMLETLAAAAPVAPESVRAGPIPPSNRRFP